MSGDKKCDCVVCKYELGDKTECWNRPANATPGVAPLDAVVERAHEVPRPGNALPVEPVPSLEQIEAVLETVYDTIEKESKSGDGYMRSLGLRGMLAVIECRNAVRDLFKKE